jgi:phytoene dehydrogenase-like protein
LVLTGKKIIIIGAGVAGLSAGCYARMNGYDVEIFEMHDKPGGMCTSWKRKDYVFDYCIHNLIGTCPDSGLRRVWKELGALDRTEFINRDEFVCIETPDSRALHWYTDLKRLENHLTAIAPDDARTMKEPIDAAGKLAGADLFAISLGGWRRMLKAMQHVSTVKRWSQVTLGQFSARLRDPFLRRALRHVMYDIPGDEVPMMALVLFMAGLSKGDLGWPVGGSLAFSRKIEKRFLDLGGGIRYKTPVNRIIVKNDRAEGVVLADDAERRSDYVISAADGYGTIYGMLEGRYITGPIESYYGGVGDSSPFGLVVFLGIEGELPDAPHALTLLFDSPVNVGDIEQDSVHVVTFGPETGLVPEGKAIIKVEVQASYPYWKERRDADLAAYRQEKSRIAEGIIDLISPRFPDLKNRIEVMDISTPPTAERFTGNRYGWQAGPPKENVSEVQRQGLSRTLPGLQGFFHAGQWATASLGVSSVAISGRNTIQALCKQDRKRFIAVA